MSIITKYNRISYVYDLMGSVMEYLKFGKWRHMILSDLNGMVLDMGVGTGKNLKYYPEHCFVVGVDISQKMLEHAKKRSKHKDNVSLMVMDGEHLAFDDNSFDYVVTTFVLCSVPDPVAALKEMNRVCKPEGIVINLEHMRSEHPVLAFIEDIFNPITVWLIGVNINRRTVDNIKKVGLKGIKECNLALKDVFRLITSHSIK
jgi:ubiquinone/menaquinone biosynthesis C-methylase UbiE